VVIRYFHIERIWDTPFKADAPLLIDTNAVLSFAIAFERFQLIRGRNHQISQIASAIQILQLLTGTLLDLSIQPFHELSVEYSLGILVLKASYHGVTLTRYVINVKRYY
jgi:hypothetical protein